MLEVLLPSRCVAPDSSSALFAVLRELSGQDEVSVLASGGRAATELLARLLVDVPGATLRAGEIWDLSLADRDRLIAHLYLQTFGDQVEARAHCVECNAGFEFDFSLSSLVDDIEETALCARHALAGADREAPLRDSDVPGFFEFGGLRFRLPTTRDEAALRALPAEAHVSELIDRCVEDSSGVRAEDSDDADTQSGVRELLENALHALAPLLTTDLNPPCVECGQVQEVEFDVVSFFMAGLARERSLVLREAHTIASTYRWGHAEILTLPRAERRTYVELIEAERGSFDSYEAFE